MDEYGAHCGHSHGMYSHADLAQHAKMHAPTESSASGAKVTKYIVIDSRDRDPRRHPSATEYVVSLPDALHNVSCARMMSAELPTSFYVFSAARANTSVVVVLDGAPHTVTIPDGNYGFTTMASTLQAALTSALGVPVTVTISPATLKCTLAVATGTVGVDTRSLASNAATQWGLAYYLGFERDRLLEGAGSVSSPRVCSVNPENYILLDIEELGTIAETAAEGQGGHASRNLFAKVPMNVGTAQVAFYDKVITANEQRPFVAKLTSLHLRWRFHDGTPVDFNGIEHSLTLEIECEPGRSNQ